jgi:Zn ribbon nucleic-acid-binding protein
MPKPNHIDNGPLKFIGTVDCPNCCEWDAVAISENDVYQFEVCSKCSYENLRELEQC